MCLTHANGRMDTYTDAGNITRRPNKASGISVSDSTLINVLYQIMCYYGRFFVFDMVTQNNMEAKTCTNMGN